MLNTQVTIVPLLSIITLVSAPLFWIIAIPAKLSSERLTSNATRSRARSALSPICQGSHRIFNIASIAHIIVVAGNQIQYRQC